MQYDAMFSIPAKGSLATMYVLAALAAYAPIASAQVSVRSSGINVQISARSPRLCCREEPPCSDCNSPNLWAVAMPCNVYICGQAASLTYSDDPSTIYPLTQTNNDDVIVRSRGILRLVGILTDPDDSVPQCDDPFNPNQQRVVVFVQGCPPAGCRYLTGEVETVLSFEVCPTCESGEEFCFWETPPDECLIGDPERVEPGCFINDIGFGGLVTIEPDLSDDPPNDPVILDFGDTFELPPPPDPPTPDIPTVSEWGLVILTLLLLVGLKIKFGRFGGHENEIAHRA